MIEKILEEINKKYPLKEKDVGKFASAKVSPMKFTLKSYEAEGLGNVSVMTGKALFGLMVMDTIVVNPFNRDMALFSYDRIHAMGNDTLFLEVYDTRLNKDEGPVNSLKEVTKKYEDIPEEPVAPNWYDSIKWGCSIKKKGKKDITPRFDEFTLEYVSKYLELCGTASICDVETKKAEAKKYTDGLISNGGPSTDQFVKAYGKDYVEELYRDPFFGV